MATTFDDKVLAETFWTAEGTTLRIKQALLVVAGILMLTLAAKIKLPVPPSPVPVNLGTFAVLTIGAAYGPRLGLTTILGYMIIGALGFDIFTNSTADKNGISYMMGTTGGYLVGFVVATLVLGLAARKGWDRSVPMMAVAMFIGSALIYVFGLAWLFYLISSGMFQPEKYSSVLDQTLTWGITPFLIGDAMKLALAALLLPALWKFIGSART